jgi:hypothetical protein
MGRGTRAVGSSQRDVRACGDYFSGSSFPEEAATGSVTLDATPN